jgi:transcriptional regulator with XRE-family HTH domain
MPQAREAKTVTGQLRESIRQSGLNQHELSRACGVGPDILSRFLRGERDMRGRTIDKLCKALGLRLVQGKPPAG